MYIEKQKTSTDKWLIVQINSFTFFLSHFFLVLDINAHTNRIRHVYYQKSQGEDVTYNCGRGLTEDQSNNYTTPQPHIVSSGGGIKVWDMDGTF